MTHRPRPSSPRGFTLIELMIVVALLGVLASLAIPGYMRFTARAARAEAVTTASDIVKVLNQAYNQNGTYMPGGSTSFSGSAWNPPGPPGTPGVWDTTLAGWKDLPYSLDTSLRMRYAYTGDAHNLTVYVCGNMTELGPPPGGTTVCTSVNGVQPFGNYAYELDLKDTEPLTSQPIETPNF